MSKLAACAFAAIFGVSCACAAETTVEVRTEEVHLSPEAKQKLEVAKQKTKSAASKAKAKTKAAAKRSRAAAHRAAQRTEASAHRAADHLRAAEGPPVVRIDTNVETNR